MHHGQGKWYPGEPLPRWAFNLFWRTDGQPLWRDASLFAQEHEPEGYGIDVAKRFAEELEMLLGLRSGSTIPAYEDVWKALDLERRLPVNINPLESDLKSADERQRLAKLLDRGLNTVAGYVLPLAPAQPGATAHGYAPQWLTCTWPLKRENLYLIEGDSPIGLRLPLGSLPWAPADAMPPQFEVDPFVPRSPLPATSASAPGPAAPRSPRRLHAEAPPAPTPPTTYKVIHTALCVEVRDGRLYVFMPPLTHLEDYLALLSQIERCAAKQKVRLWLEGYPPPRDPRIKLLSVTPDPGVIEVNVHPALSWPELVHNTTTLYEEARQVRLGTEKFMIDGRHTGTGGGNHATLGGATPADSPMLRRPDVLKSLITYWQNHPALSYLFSGTFIGPTSQAPRVDEARDDNLYELGIAFEQMDQVLPTLAPGDRPWIVDRLLRNLLVDLTGNTHRAEFSIDKLYSPDGPSGRLGLVEFRAFEMPPHARMSLVQMLLLRALVACFWRQPYHGKLVQWGTGLHDRWMLPHFVAQDIRDVVNDLRAYGYAFDAQWFEPFVEFRFPRYGTVAYDGVELELRQAIEPWHVLGEEIGQGGTARYVDSSVERMQMRVRGMTDGRHAVTCNGRVLPLHPTGVPGEYVAGVRFRAWSPWSALHPTIKVHAPLVFDLVDTWNGHALGGCTYHVSHPGGRSEEHAPVNANAAEARRFARFWSYGHTPGPVTLFTEAINPAYPMTLDLRKQAQ
jgi:uncharacterized protein (DUF2126 family)